MRRPVPLLGSLRAPCRLPVVPPLGVPRAYYAAAAVGTQIYGLYNIESQQICRLPVIQLFTSPDDCAIG